MASHYFIPPNALAMCHSIQRLEGVVVFFLKHLYHARQIRNRILECFERASNPTIPKVQRDRLLSFIVVGGGPTSCEFMSELHEFINDDVASWFPDLIPHIKMTLVEAGPGILGSFDKALSEYYLKELEKKNINVRLNTAVDGIDERYIENEQVSKCPPYTHCSNSCIAVIFNNSFAVNPNRLQLQGSRMVLKLTLVRATSIVVPSKPLFTKNIQFCH